MKLIAGVISLLLVAVISGSASGEENPTPEEIVTVTDEESIIITEIPSCPFITDEEWLKQYIPTDETCTDFVEVGSLDD